MSDFGISLQPKSFQCSYILTVKEWLVTSLFLAMTVRPKLFDYNNQDDYTGPNSKKYDIDNSSFLEFRYILSMSLMK